MQTDAVLLLFHSLMQKKHERKLSGSYEAKAYKEQAKLLREHYQYVLSCEKSTNH